MCVCTRVLNVRIFELVFLRGISHSNNFWPRLKGRLGGCAHIKLYSHVSADEIFFG